MQLIDHPAACRLMQAVYILRHYRSKPAGFFKLRQFYMCRIRLCIQSHHLLPVKIIKSFRIFHKEAVAYNLLRRILILLMIDTVRTSEIRYPALR